MNECYAYCIYLGSITYALHLLLPATWCWCNVLIIMTDCGLVNQGIVWIPADTRDFSLFQSRQAGSGAHPTSFSVGTLGSFLEVMWHGPEAEHSPLFSAKFKNEWNCTSAPPVAFVCAQWKFHIYFTPNTCLTLLPPFFF
jgi:hypothetical protein